MSYTIITVTVKAAHFTTDFEKAARHRPALVGASTWKAVAWAKRRVVETHFQISTLRPDDEVPRRTWDGWPAPAAS